MNLQLLIDSILRQATVLVAQLATAQGVRAPLANVANQVFLDLSNELNQQGVSRKVSADMFGLALRTYLRKIQRLSESSTDHGRSLWEAVLAYVDQRKIVNRADVLGRFHRDDAELVRGVLHDLCESALVFRTGSGHGTVYKSAGQDDSSWLGRDATSTGHDEFVWVLIYREGPLTRDALAKRMHGRDFEASLERLIESGRIARAPRGTDTEYSASEFFIPRDASAGWEAAVFDHFQAMVKAIIGRIGPSAEGREKQIGGSTYSFDVWPGHPLEAEALCQLQEFRERTTNLRERIRAHNKAHEHPRTYLTVTLYAGQSVLENGPMDAENDVAAGVKPNAIENDSGRSAPPSDDPEAK
jgi:hypothetical protein